MSEELDDVVLPPVEVDPVFVTAVEDAMSGVPAQVPDPNRALGADPHDFAGLYIRHRSSFAAHARRFLRDPRDVDEVVQEAFLRLFLALPELSTELQALAYCRRTVTNLCIDRYRADKRRPRLVNIETLPPNDFPDDEADDPVVRAEDAAFVREALSLLSPLHRDALVKREIEEKSLPVIAQELGIPEESVKHLLHRARRALRRHLAKTHLAPGADLESVSTMTLLAKSAAAGGGRLGVVLVFTLAVLVGAKPELPATALMSWPIQDLIAPVTHALSLKAPEPQQTIRTRAKPVPVAPVAPLRTTVREDEATTLPKPAPANKPVATAAGVTALVGSPSPVPAAVPVVKQSASPSPSAEGSASPSPSASPSASPSPSPKPSSSPSSAPSKEPVRARAEASGSPSPSPEPPLGESLTPDEDPPVEYAP
ncbi:MAG: sigma-70 family RNA polymerase sigma factor [Actinobacteria bacterium]|nr:sigma-70 family RNA polymerase sigma factor [Actinomycetota bacterium]